MNATRHIEPDDLALYAMQLLAADEASVMAAHLEQCGDCRKALAEVQGDLAVYAHTVDMHSPPAQARERLMKQVAREKKDRSDRVGAAVESISRPATAASGAGWAVAIIWPKTRLRGEALAAECFRGLAGLWRRVWR